MRKRLFRAAALACLAISTAMLWQGAVRPGFVQAAHAQSARAQSPGYFIPPQPSAPRGAAPARAPRAARSVPVAAAPLPEPEPDQVEADGGAGQQQPLPPLPQPAVPTLPKLPHGAPPPAVVVGVLGVPDVMRQSNAAQIIQHIVGARKERLRADVDRAQATWRELERQLQADAPKLTPDQGRARERSLRERVNADRRVLQDRNRIISEAGQVALNQIEAVLVAVIRQVAESRGMNVVLHRSQVALNMPEFDITEQVVGELNKLMPTVQIPDEKTDPATLPKDWGTPNLNLAAIPAAPAAPPAAGH